MLEAIDETFPDEATWTNPSGGFYVWVTLPDWVDTRAMLAAAVERRVAYVPGTAFYPDGRGTDQMRLAFCYPRRTGSARASRASVRSSRTRSSSTGAWADEGRGAGRGPDARTRRLATISGTV